MSCHVMSIMSMYATCRIFPSTVLYCTMVATLSHIHWWHLWNPMNSCWAFHMNTRLDHGLRAYKHVWHVCAFCESLFRTSAFAQASVWAAKSSRYFFAISSCKEGGDGEMHLTTTLLWRRDGYKQVYITLLTFQWSVRRKLQNLDMAKTLLLHQTVLHWNNDAALSNNATMLWYALECWVLRATCIWKLAFDSFQLVLRKTVREGIIVVG